MSLELIGAILTAFMGGNLLQALVTYINNRRTGKTDANTATFTNLTTMNERLTKQLADVQEQLDAERGARRRVEDELAVERRERHALEELVAVLERRTPEGGP
jgi:hypothetical protein